MKSMTNLAHGACSFLFVPATRPERLPKALASGADMVIADWEDAVAPADKQSARAALEQAVQALPAAGRARLLVRTNACGSPWFDEDVQALAHEYCRQGVPVDFLEERGADHTTAAIPFEAVLGPAQIQAWFAGLPPVNDCMLVGRGNSLAPLPQG